MNADALRRLLADAELERVAEAENGDAMDAAVFAIVDRLAGERLFEAARTERETIARRASDLLRAEIAEEDPSGPLRLVRGAWHEKASAAEALLQRCLSPHARLAGAAGIDMKSARALAIALHECLAPEESAPLAPTRPTAALQRLAAETVAAGETLCGDARHRAVAIALGTAASALLSNEAGQTKDGTALRALCADIAAQNAARLAFWDGTTPETVRCLGAAAAAAAFGSGSMREPAPQRSKRASVAFRLPEAWHERFSHMAAAEAADVLEHHALHPRTPEAERLMAEALAETLRAHPSPDRASFAQALEIDPAPLRKEALRPGRALFRASTRGKHRAHVICTGTRGRRVRCRAVTDTEGALVGYRAFDPLSREIGGRPLYALYDVHGIRCGYAWADGPHVACAGAPEQGFVTAPGVIFP